MKPSEFVKELNKNLGAWWANEFEYDGFIQRQHLIWQAIEKAGKKAEVLKILHKGKN